MPSLDKVRLQLSRSHGFIWLALIGVLIGLLAGGVNLLFRWVVTESQILILPGGEDDFESLATVWRMLLPLLGSLLLIALFAALPIAMRGVGVVHVLSRMRTDHGLLPWPNMLVQFFGAAVALVSGHSVGREGPSVHLGAASGSVLGQWLRLPDNSLRVLVACGVAAAIAASFNTPLAGVIFAMEVVLLEYSIMGFTPVMLAAVVGAMLTRSVYGDAVAFSVPSLSWESLLQLPYLTLAGLVVGVMASVFIILVTQISRRGRQWAWSWRFLLAGVLMGLVAWPLPEVMGIGYDSVSQAMQGEFALTLLICLAVGKLVMTAVVIGLGIPGGLIGPTLVMGAALGALVGECVVLITGAEASAVGFYALMGMGAMMGAALQAPLAALIALLELTAMPDVLLPGMWVIVVAQLVVVAGFRQRSVFESLLAVQLPTLKPPDLLSSELVKQGVAGAMSTSCVSIPRRVALHELENSLVNAPDWVVILDREQPLAVISAYHLQDLLPQLDQAEALDLMRIASVSRAKSIALQATLNDALRSLQESQVEALCVQGRGGQIYGVVTSELIQATYTRRH